MNCKGRHKLAANPIAFGELCYHLNNGYYTRAQLKELVGITDGTLRKWLTILRRRRLWYVWDYQKNPAGHPTEILAWGFEMCDAPRPKPMTQAQYEERRRMKRRGTFGLGKSN